ncbi:hypothetical protein [Methylocella sp.]
MDELDQKVKLAALQNAAPIMTVRRRDLAAEAAPFANMSKI